MPGLGRLFFAVALATVVMVIPKAEGRDESTTWYIHTVSYHYLDRSSDMNEVNWGLGYEFPIGNREAIVGAYYNTNRRMTSYALWGESWRHGGYEFGAKVGGAVGYEDYPVLPMVALSIERGPVAIHVMPAVVNLSLRFE